jgi:hypothetical protein
VNEHWVKAYELNGGERTGRWQWLNERGERDEFYPGHWLDAGDICPPPCAEAA